MMFIRRFIFFFSWIFFFFLLWGRSIDSAVKTEASSPLLVYIYTKSFLPVWDDALSGANKDVSIWTPTDKKGTFVALGDVIQSSYGYPAKDVMMVMDRSDGLVVPPDTFTLLWNDKNSRTIKNDVSIYKMTARKGYTCIGHVTVTSYTSMPDKKKYRCLRDDLLIKGYQEVDLWSTLGSQTTIRKSFWTVAPLPDDSKGLETGLFLVGSDESSPSSEQAYVVLSSKAVFWEVAYKPSQPSIVLYQTSDVDLIWNDAGSAGFYAASIWRVKECCSLGDMAASDYYQMAGFVAKDLIQGTLSKPIDFTEIYSNRQARGKDLAIWKPICQPSYIALGHVATKNYNKPRVEDSNFRCVNLSIVADSGKWRQIWTDRDTASKQAGTMFIAEATSPSTTDVSAMTAIGRYGTPTAPAYVLKSDNVQMRYSKFIKSIHVVNAVYDLKNKKEVAPDPNDKQMLSTDIQYIDNCKAKANDSPIYSKIMLTYTEGRELTWRHDLTVEVGVSVGFTVDIPFVGETSVDVSVSVAETTSRETKVTGSKSKSKEAGTTIAPKKKGGFYMQGRDKVYEIPWTGTAVYTYVDGSTREEPIGGIYSDMRVAEAITVALPTEDC